MIDHRASWRRVYQHSPIDCSGQRSISSATNAASRQFRQRFLNRPANLAELSDHIELLF